MKKEKRTKEQAKLDQAFRILFRLSKPLTVQLVNGLFGEKYSIDEVKRIHYGNAEFVNDAYERIAGDLFLRVETGTAQFQYHVEFQTLNDQSMVIRMFRYGFEKAIELMLNEMEDATVERERAMLVYPQQVVIFLEENHAIGDLLTMPVRFPNGEEILYEVPVLRYWKLTARDVREKKLYALLPLQVFRSRKRLRQITTSGRSEEEKQSAIAQEFEGLKSDLAGTIAVLNELVEQGELSLRAMDRMLRVVESILTYLYNKYGGSFVQMKEEVMVMAKSFIDPEVLKQGRNEGKIEGKIEGKLEVARNLLLLGFDPEVIQQAANLSAEQLASLTKSSVPDSDEIK